MEVAVVATAITVMGIMVALGVLVASQIHITRETKQLLVIVVLNIAVPSVILNGVFNTDVSDQLLRQVAVIFVLSIIFHLAAIGAALIFARIAGFKSDFAKRMTILAALGNTGFIGIPLCATIFGPTGGLLAAIFDAGLDFVIFTVGLYLLQSGRTFRLSQLKSLLNLPLAAVIVGISSAFLELEPPAVLRQLVELLSGLAAPLAMLYIGILLQQLLKRTGFRVFPQIWFPLTVRLLLIPAVTLAVLPFLPLEELTRNVVIVLSGMPTFMLAAILFSRYTDEEDTAVMTISFSTILSLVTIPLIAYAATFLF
ncbi:AEC family transporter [Alkalicoccus halolimnae]|uniref:AEC family transporter n=1 Tax=Alkalicoccus halolimnae TaxID=1667239 RepID=A0A5C7F6G4_9BACI|nr:AEC family transporter [Alkalicoccus halolimnae]TXF85603.1 AEC family transporter [Alkalicoccus halolimnae]